MGLGHGPSCTDVNLCQRTYKPHKHLGLYDRTISSLCVYFAPLLLLPSGQFREALITLIQKLYIIIAREVTYSRWLGPIASRKDPSCRWIAHLTICHILPYTTPPPSSIPCQLQLHQSWEQPEEKSHSRPLYRLKLGIFNARGPSSSIAAFRPSVHDEFYTVRRWSRAISVAHEAEARIRILS
ncbi:hypothetical protein Pst134EA_004610 [Puccinia striiformis f. sp. tritici]|uniref:hypothetical protein n=1 Tax=Puccinia striiformis f. sp. tritici TaxID=168172 RepID=UPI002008CF4F|nr:hypothetical protein Pst134EA_004610 [Puccinia striiformis f. sp. tritici]KAH9470686.1 hypothetical protein Pst134EA_004610 [Puccinia striiformis f. sp. tritici]